MPEASEDNAFHVDTQSLQAGLADVEASPLDRGVVTLLVIRPEVGERAILDQVAVDVAAGIVGDTWLPRGNKRTPDGSANSDAQVTVMNARAALLMAGSTDRMALAGDQVYVDLDLSTENLPAGTRLELGDAVLEVTALPHTGCAKFSARFGVDALRLTATPQGRFLRLRGINTRVAVGGTIRVGDPIRIVRGE